MARFEFVAIAAIALILAVSLQHASAIKCWVCNSRDHRGCEDPFLGENIKHLQQECPHAESGTRACVKAKVESTGMIYRMCSNETVSKIANFVSVSCTYEHAQIVGDTKRIDFSADICEVCIDGDGCNGASKYAPIAVTIAIPLAIMKILLF